MFALYPCSNNNEPIQLGSLSILGRDSPWMISSSQKKLSCGIPNDDAGLEHTHAEIAIIVDGTVELTALGLSSFRLIRKSGLVTVLKRGNTVQIDIGDIIELDSYRLWKDEPEEPRYTFCLVRWDEGLLERHAQRSRLQTPAPSLFKGFKRTGEEHSTRGRRVSPTLGTEKQKKRHIPSYITEDDSALPDPKRRILNSAGDQASTKDDLADLVDSKAGIGAGSNRLDQTPQKNLQGPSPVPSPQQLVRVFAAGAVVTVQARTWSGMNRPGGAGRVTKVNSDGTYNVKYILGGSDKSVHPAFMEPFVDPGLRQLQPPGSSAEAADGQAPAAEAKGGRVRGGQQAASASESSREDIDHGSSSGSRRRGRREHAAAQSQSQARSSQRHPSPGLVRRSSPRARGGAGGGDGGDAKPAQGQAHENDASAAEAGGGRQTRSDSDSGRATATVLPDLQYFNKRPVQLGDKVTIHGSDGKMAGRGAVKARNRKHDALLDVAIDAPGFVGEADGIAYGPDVSTGQTPIMQLHPSFLLPL